MGVTARLYLLTYLSRADEGPGPTTPPQPTDEARCERQDRWEALSGASVVLRGRHSIHTGIGGHPKSLVPTLDLGRFRAGSDNWTGRIGGFHDYAPTVVARNLKSLGLSRRKRVPVGEYLAAIERSELSYVDAFMELAFGFAPVRKEGK